MAKAITERKGFSKTISGQSIFWSFFNGVFAVIVIIALLNYDPQTYHVYPPEGTSPLLGQLGIFIARHLFGLLGISAWLIPWILCSLAYLILKKISNREKFIKITSIFAVILCVSILSNLRDDHFRMQENEPLLNPNKFEHGAGGSIGAFLYSGVSINASSQNRSSGYLKLWFGSLGTTAFTSLLIVFCIWLHFGKIKFISLILNNCNSFLPEKNNEPEGSQILPKKSSSKLGIYFPKLNFNFISKNISDDPLFGDVSKISDVSKCNDSSGIRSKKSSKNSDSLDDQIIEPIADQDEEKTPNSELHDKTETESNLIVSDDTLENSSSGMEGFKVVRAAKTEKAIDLFPERKGDYHFPSMDLLMDPPEEESVADEDHILKAKRLQDTLREFKIEVEMGEVHTGPVITRYDLHPAAGVRVEKIANLDKNLAMALKAESVRILAPVPGKGCVGIEVPNTKPLPVCMKEILQSKAWHEAGAEIPIVLGKEASGKPLVADLTKMPHLLVAGSTGSGKTVCINSIIASLCYHSSPDDVRFIMVDPKIVEMKVYNDLPHMLIPVVTEPKKVPGALKWLLVEMERRYQIFSKLGVRNIAGFNAKILKDKAEKEKAQLLDAEMTPEERAALTSVQVPRDDDVLEIPENKLPYIVCIIDELADLMMVAQADVETGIARLAQLARAAGIHLIIATQRPSVNVITGVIKANLPSRISFRVASYRDSQTILDGKGAEALIGKGDMLFIPPGSSTFTRAQGAFVSDDEINGIVEFLKINGPPQIIEEVRAQVESAGEEDILGESEDSDDDPMTRKAIEVIRTTKRASTSNLQRKLSIGYNRAARIMDDLEDRGLVGPDIPGQGREILMDL